MKIDGNLRQAIRSACNSQPDTNWTQIEKDTQAQFQAFLDSKRGAVAKRLTKEIRAMQEHLDAKRAELCKRFGLTCRSDKMEISSCSEGGKARYIKAGGKVTERKSKWSFDAKMQEVASASEKDALIVLKGIGINWS